MTCVALLLAAASSAQEQGVIAPLPPIAEQPSLQRITPENHDNDSEMLSTRHARKAAAAPAHEPLPWQAAAPTVPSSSPPNKFMPASVPFGRASESLGAEIPAGPHSAVSVPVGDVDAVEVSEPAPPEPPEPGTDPVTEDATAITEFSGPVFEGVEDDGGARKMLLRVLNKVTAQSMLFRARPKDVVSFGKLKIQALMCRVSAPTSQADSAALLDIREELPGKEGIKQLFRGWMYQSSPSLTALEHPIYDVTMVGCEIAALAPKTEEKQEKTDAKKPEAKKKP